jgi:hypothetical protein
MLRASQNDAGDRVTVRIEGRLVGPWVEELDRLTSELLAEHRALTLDLADLQFLGNEGTALLRDLVARNVVLTNCSPFVMEQLRL